MIKIYTEEGLFSFIKEKGRINNMRRKIFAIVGLGILILWSCGHKSDGKSMKNADGAVLQEEDGTLRLKLEKATCYSDNVNPSSNTAEWSVVVSTPGRFKVWLSSATRDTTDLKYDNSVKVSLLDNQLEADPVCDKVVRNSDEVDFPYFRADSYMGSLYISEPGQYNVQVISEKVTAGKGNKEVHTADDTRLMSVILDPMIR